MRTREHLLLAGLAFLGLALVAVPALADVDENEFPGELRVKLSNYAYPRVTVDGEEWDSTEFERNGKTVIVLDLDRAKEKIQVTLTPSPDLAPEVLNLSGKDFKRQRKKRTVFYVAKRSVKFAKASTKPAPAPKPDTGDEEEAPAPKPAPAPAPDDDL